MLFFELGFHTIEVGGQAVKTPGGGFVLTRFGRVGTPPSRDGEIPISPVYPVRIEDRELSIRIEHFFPPPRI